MTDQTQDEQLSPEATFDVDALIDRRRRLTRSIQFRRADDLAEQHAALATRRDDLRSKLARAELNPDAPRGISEPGSEALRAMLEQVDADEAALAAQWDARGVPVTVEERTRGELAALTKDLRRGHERTVDELRGRYDGDEAAFREAVEAARADHAETMLLTQVAECVVSPALGVDDLRRVYRSSIAGETAVSQIWQATQEVCAFPAAPFSPGSSPTLDGLGSAQS